MGLLNLFNKPEPSLLRLPSGSFTIDRKGAILVGTIPSHFPRELMEQIGQQVLQTFSEAAAAQIQISEITVSYPSFRIAAKEMRGGALVFLTPLASPNTN